MTGALFSPLVGQILASQGAVALLESARLAGAIAVSPLPWSYAPLKVRIGALLTLLLVVHSPANVAPGFEVGSAVFGVMSEVMVGVAIGFVLRLVFAIAEMAAGAISPTMGLGAAQIFMPGHGQTGILEQILVLLSVWLAVIAGVHRTLIAALIESFRVLPAGSVASPGAGAPVLLALSTTAIETGVRLAMPILAVLFVVQLGLAFISRAAPAMQIFSVGFAVTLITGGVVLLAVLPDFSQLMIAELSHTAEHIEAVVSALSSG